MRSFLLAPLIIALSTPAFAGLPSNKTEKWVRTNPNWMIDTEDIDLKRSKIRFYVKRNALAGDFSGNTSRAEWAGKMRVDCKTFETMMEAEPTDQLGLFTYPSPWTTIKPDQYAYGLANYFCFLTGEEGYTREGDKEFVGLGMSIIKELGTARLIVNGIIKDSPVGKSKVRYGDEIISIDGKSVVGMSVKEAFKYLDGAEGDKVTVIFQRTNESGKIKKLKLGAKREKFIVSEPDWVKKIIKIVQTKPIRKSNQSNINCDSPAWRNRPQCIDY